MIKFRARFGRIEAMEVLRETDKQVVLPPSCRGGREIHEAKCSYWGSWHDTWEDAHAFLVDEANKKVNALRLELERAKGALGQIKGMKPPAAANETVP